MDFWEIRKVQVVVAIFFAFVFTGINFIADTLMIAHAHIIFRPVGAVLLIEYNLVFVAVIGEAFEIPVRTVLDRKSTRLNSSHP